jgi:hypothetical protein
VSGDRPAKVKNRGDGWLLVAELDGLDSDALVRTYTWGLDLSGAFQGLPASRTGLAGAGGILLCPARRDYGGQVGGLLTVDDTAEGGFCGF